MSSLHRQYAQWSQRKRFGSFFKKFGKPNDFLIKAGFGFVEFDDYRDADDAVYELNGKVCNVSQKKHK